MTKAYIATCMIGVFAIDENGNTLTYKLFQKAPEAAAKALSSEKLTEEEKSVLDDLIKSGYTEIVVDKNLEFSGIKIIFEKNNNAS